MKSAYQQCLDTGCEPLLLRLAEDMRDLLQAMRAAPPKQWRALVDGWSLRHHAKAALALDEVATFLVDLLRAAESAKPKRRRCGECDGSGSVEVQP